MDLQFLEANKYLIKYYYIYKYKNLNKASENFYLSSSDRNMKYAVEQLESFYGVKLIKVEGNKLNFTDFGHILGEYSKKIYELNIEINSRLEVANLKEVRFATSNDFYKYYIKPVFDKFQTENKDVRITLLKTNQYDAIQRLLNHEIDFVVGSQSLFLNSSLIYHKIAETRILLATKKENIEKFKNIKSLKELEPYRAAITDNTHPSNETILNTLEKEDVKLNIFYQTTDFESLIDSLRNDYVDFAIVGSYDSFSDIDFVDISFLFTPIAICFIYRKGEPQNKAIQKLIDISLILKVKPKEV